MEAEELIVLVRAAADGDARAWKVIVDRYNGLVWSVVRSFRLNRHDAEDVAQTTWERLARSISDLREPEYLGSWLATTARREALRVRQVRVRSLPSGDMAWTTADHSDDTPERLVIDEYEEAERDRDARRAWQAMRTLSMGCQQLLRILTASPPPTYAEAAAALGRPVGYIGPSRRRCLDRLRDRLTADVSHPRMDAHDS